jgi:hypothetical protein
MGVDAASDRRATVDVAKVREVFKGQFKVVGTAYLLENDGQLAWWVVARTFLALSHMHSPGPGARM